MKASSISKFGRISLVLMGLLFLALQPGYAQSPVTATVDRASISSNELVMLTITVDVDTTSPRVTLPAMDKFTIITSSRSSQMSIVNGNISTRHVQRYLLRPLATGQLTIDPIEVEIDGQTYLTDPITIEVTDTPAVPPSAGSGGSERDLTNQTFFVEAEVDNPNPYLGEQVIYTHRLYSAFTSFSEPNYDLPRFTGFWTDDEPVVTQRHHQIEGRRFTVREVKIVLFPTRTGKLTIDETVVTSRSSLLSDGFILQTEPVDLEVKPLPDDAPPDFSGAVGLFTLDAEVSNNRAKVDEPITLLVIMTGQGNISTAPDPVWPDMPEWRVFDAQASTFTDFRDGHLIGRRVYERLMVPGVAGDFTIPPITYTYFDPQAGEYRTISTNPIEMTVEPGAGEPPPPLVIGANKEEIERLGADIRHIKPVPSILTLAEMPLTAQRGYWLLWGLPIFVWVVNRAWTRRQMYFKQNVGLARSLRAYKQARKSLAQARSSAQDPYLAAGHILNVYLSDKLNQPVVGLTQNVLTELLQSKNIDAGLVGRVHECLMESDLGRFGPGGSAPNHAQRLLDKTESLVTDLEEAFKS